MKNQLITGMLGIAAMLASCSQQEDLLAANEDKIQTITVSLNTDDGMQTRAEYPATISRYVMEAYEISSDGTCTPTPVEVIRKSDGMMTGHHEQADGVFTLALDRSKQYCCLFWADNDVNKNIYDVTDLKAVKLNAGKEAIEHSYFAYKDISSAQAVQNVYLYHAVARISLYEKDKIKAGSTLTMTYTPNTTFNVMDGTVTEGSEKSKEITIENEITGTEAAPVQIGESFYLLAPDKWDNVQNFTFVLNDGEMTTTKNLTNVPVRATFATNIRGKFSDNISKQFSITLDEAWNTSEYEDVLPVVTLDGSKLGSIEELQAILDASGKSGTLKLTGEITEAHIDVLKEAIGGSYSYVLDMSEATLTDGLPGWAFYQTYGVKGIILPKNMTKIKHPSVFLNSFVEFITLPEGLEEIAYSAFIQASQLKRINMDETKVTEIPKSAFENCTSLEEIAFGNLTMIYANAFKGCSKLKSIDLSKCTQVPDIGTDVINTKFIVPNGNVILYVAEDMLDAFTDAWGGFGFAAIKVKQ